MNLKKSLLAATAAAMLIGAPVASAASAAPVAAHQGAVYVQTDNLSANSVVVYKRSASGRLTKAGSYSTGGKGGMLAGSKVDHLASQGSLAMDAPDGLLFAVNAGSDTITEFTVDGTKLTREAVVPSGGQFPVSLTVSGETLYVLNGRGGGSIQGYKLVEGKPTLVKGWNRKLGLDPNTTPEFTHTPGQVAFTPDGSKLVVTTKGNTSAVDVFKVAGSGSPSKAPVVTSLPEAVPFGVDFDSAGHLLIAKAGPNAIGEFTIASTGALNEVASGPTGQEATCWITHIGSTFYLSNAGSGSVSSIGVQPGKLIGFGNTTTSPGTVDAAPAGKNLYVQTGAEGVVDEFTVGAEGKLTSIGKVKVPGAVGGEGIVAS
jgi:6-phosphogluconolactonase (cycloisomerase 2 family)